MGGAGVEGGGLVALAGQFGDDVSLMPLCSVGFCIADRLFSTGSIGIGGKTACTISVSHINNPAPATLMPV